MFNGKGPKYYQNKKPHHEYETYSESATSLEWPLWKHADELKRKRHVKFDKEYDYSSRDDLYDGRNINEHSYPYTYSSNNIYEAGNDIYDYHTEGSRYTLYDQSPHRIMYTETESAYTTVDSDPNLTQRIPARDLGYKPKYRHNHSHRYKNNDTIPSEVTDIESSSFGGNLNVYFARQPTSHYAFMHKKPRGHDVTSQTESEVQDGTVTETDEESDYPTNDKGRQSNLQVYTTTVAENETNGVFNKGLQKNSQERLIAVTDYDNIPLLAFKSKNTNALPQISMSGMVYVPVIVMPNEKKLSNPKNSNTHLIPCKNCEVEENPVQSIKVYTALNARQKNIFKKNQEENYESPQHHSKTNSNRQQKSTALNIENTETSPTRESDLKSVINKPKTSNIYLPSILRMDRAEKNKSSINSSSPKTEQKQLNQSQIKINRSNTSVSSRKSIPKSKNNKREENTSRIIRKTTKDKKVLKSNMSNKVDDYGDKIPRTKSDSSNISQKSTMSIPSVLTKRRASKTRSSIKKSETQALQRLISKSPSGRERGSSFYQKAHQKVLQAIKDENIPKSKITKGEQDMSVTKQNPSEAFKSSGESELSTYENNNVKNLKSTPTMTSKILPQSKLAPHTQFRRNLSDIKADGSEDEPLSKQKQNQDGQNTINNLSETKTRRINGASKSIVQQQEISVAMLEISTNNKKSALVKDSGSKYKKETNIENKSFTEKNETAEKKSANEIIRAKERKPFTQKSILKNNENNKNMKYDTIEESKLKGQQSDLNKGSRKSLPPESSKVGETKTLSKNSTVQNQGNNIQIKQDNTEERAFKTQHTDLNQPALGRKKSLVKQSSKTGETQSFTQINTLLKPVTYSNVIIEQVETEEFKLKNQYSDLNQTVKDSKKSLVKQSSKAEETKPSQKSLLQNQNTEIKDNHSRSDGINRNKTQTAEEVKSVLNKKSQIQEYQSKDKINEGASKSVVRETIGVNKSGTSVAQQPRPTREERISKVSGSPASNIEDDKNQKSATKVSNYSQKGPTLVGGKLVRCTACEKSKSESSLEEERNIINDQRTTIQAKQGSKVNRKSNTNDGGYIPVGEQKHKISYGKKLVPDNVQKQTSNDQKYMDQRNSKSKKESLQKKSLISSNQTKSELISQKKQASKVSKQSSRREMQHCYKLWGYDCSTLITFCFQIAQFILGVSTHDKFIEILGNFD